MGIASLMTCSSLLNLTVVILQTQIRADGLFITIYRYSSPLHGEYFKGDVAALAIYSHYLCIVFTNFYFFKRVFCG